MFFIVPLSVQLAGAEKVPEKITEDPSVIVTLPPAAKVPPIIKFPVASAPVVMVSDPKSDPDRPLIEITVEPVRLKPLLDPAIVPPSFAIQICVIGVQALVAHEARGARIASAPTTRTCAKTGPRTTRTLQVINRVLLVAYFEGGRKVCNPPNRVFQAGVVCVWLDLDRDPDARALNTENTGVHRVDLSLTTAGKMNGHARLAPHTPAACLSESPIRLVFS